MQIFMVGGAVRDSLLGLPVSDRDYVVVGASPEQMEAAGFRPVGKDFPVFLHPHTHEEYALARTERKTALGYKGFTIHADSGVTLEEDLARRDLTINAIARAADGSLIDPWNGQADLQARVLRHVSPAFAEDPVRILRLARFAARFTDFSVAADTMQLMCDMVQHGEADALVAERVWQELARGLLEAQPARMFAVLYACGALQRILPELAQVWAQTLPATSLQLHEFVAQVLNLLAGQQATLEIRFAAMLQMLDGQAAVLALCQRLKVPADCRDLALMCVREARALRQQPAQNVLAAVDLLGRCDAWRKPLRFEAMLQAVEAGSQVLQQPSPAQQTTAWRQALQFANSIDPGAIAARVARELPGQPQQIAQAIHAARVAALHAGYGNPV